MKRLLPISSRTWIRSVGIGMIVLAVLILASLVYRCFQPADIGRYLELHVEADRAEILQLFYGTGEGYSPRQAHSRIVNDDGKSVVLRFPLPNSKITHFRLDPVAHSGTIILSRMGVGEANRELYRELPLDQWSVVRAIADIELRPYGLAIEADEEVGDPQLEMQLELPLIRNGLGGLWSPLTLLLLVLALLSAYRLFRWARIEPEGKLGMRECLHWCLAVLSCGVIGALALPMLSWVVSEAYREQLYLELDMRIDYRTKPDVLSIVQVFYDTGRGIWSGEGGDAVVTSETRGKRTVYRLRLPSSSIYGLRLDPLNHEFSMDLYDIRVRSSKGTIDYPLLLSDIHPRNEIATVERTDHLSVKSLPGALDPQMKVGFPRMIPGYLLRRFDLPGWPSGFVLGLILSIPCLLRPVRLQTIRRSGGILWARFSVWRNWFHGRPGEQWTSLILALILLAAIGVRVLAVYAVYPGDAPDERAHMALATAMSEGKVLAVHEEFPITGYAFSIYNPLGYLPAAAALGVAWSMDREEEPPSQAHFFRALREVQEHRQEWDRLPSESRSSWDDYLQEQQFAGHSWFSFESNYIARWGHFIWGLAYVVMIPLVIRPYRKSEKIMLAGILAFVPQIIFVQGYLNLDSIGLFVALYLFWAVREERWRQVAVASLLAAFCKMNVYCVYFLPAVYLFFRYPWQWSHWIKRSLVLFVPAFLVMATWYWFSHHIKNPHMEGGALAIAALYGVEPGGDLVFTWDFLYHTLMSSFGHFSYLNQPMPIDWGIVLWIFVLISLGLVTIISLLWIQNPLKNLCNRKGDATSSLTAAVFVVLLVNVFIHYYASYGNNGYSPQGRYLFPSLVMFICFWPYATRILRRGLAPLRVGINVGLALLFFFFAFYSLKDMNYNRISAGFPSDWTGEPMHNIWESIEPLYPF